MNERTMEIWPVRTSVEEPAPGPEPRSHENDALDGAYQIVGIIALLYVGRMILEAQSALNACIRANKR
jgi:hypothetical protein